MKGFYVLPSYSEAIMSLPGEYGAEAAFAVIHYGATGKLPDKMSEVVRAFLMLITPILDRTAADAENGKNGGRPAKRQVGECENPPENEKGGFEKTQKTQKGGFPLSPTPPIPKNKELRQGSDVKQTAPFCNEGNCDGEEVRLEQILSIAETEKIDSGEAERFYNYYKSQGWLFSNGRPVTDIPAALRRWDKSRFRREEKHFANERKYTKEQLEPFLGNPDDFDSL